MTRGREPGTAEWQQCRPCWAPGQPGLVWAEARGIGPRARGWNMERTWVESVGAWSARRQGTWLEEADSVWFGGTSERKLVLGVEGESQGGRRGDRCGKEPRTSWWPGAGPESLLSRWAARGGGPSPTLRHRVGTRPNCPCQAGISLVQFVLLNCICRNMNPHSLLRGQLSICGNLMLRRLAQWYPCQECTAWRHAVPEIRSQGGHGDVSGEDKAQHGQTRGAHC